MPRVPQAAGPVEYEVPQPPDPKFLAMAAETMRKNVEERIENPGDMSPELLKAYRDVGIEILRAEILRSQGIDYTPTFMEPKKKDPNFYKDVPAAAESKRWSDQRRRDAESFKDLESEMEKDLADQREIGRADLGNKPRKKFDI